MRRRCKIVTVEQDLYHGSPIRGMSEIIEADRLYPQSHAIFEELETLCVSPNDNMLRFFGEDKRNRLNGIRFAPTELKCMILDDFHLSLISHHWIAEWERDFPDEYTWLGKLGHSSFSARECMRVAEFMSLLPPGVDGLLFPWTFFEYGQIHAQSYNDEAELSLLQPGCDKLWAQRQVYYVHGKEYDVEEGEELIKSLAKVRPIRLGAQIAS
jgi:hypothetical protein